MSGIPETSTNHGVEKNVPIAIEYWKMASENAVDMASLNLASLFLFGLEGETAYQDLAQVSTYLDRVQDPRFKDEIINMRRLLEKFKNDKSGKVMKEYLAFRSDSNA